MTARNTTVLVVDDHPMIRQGLRQLLDGEMDIDVCGDVGTAQEAMTAVDFLHPDMVITDIGLGSSDGLELVKQIVARWPDLSVIVLSMHSEKVYAERALRAGAQGYVMKDEPPETLVAAIRRVRDGGVHVSEEIQASLLQRLASGKNAGGTPMEALSDRELAVFRLIGEGQGNRVIADNLHLSVKTVESYRENIKKKLGLESATELLQHATLWIHTESGS